MSAANLLKVFANCITAKGTEEEEEKSKGEGKDESDSKREETKTNREDQAEEKSEMLATIAANCNYVLAFLQAIAVKSPRIIAAPLLLRTACASGFAGTLTVTKTREM